MINVKFNNWDKYNKRQKDIRSPYWFSMSNNFFYDPEFYDFTSEEKCTFFYLLAEASRGGCYGECKITETHYSRITGYIKQTLYSTLDKLLKLKVAAVSRQDGGGNPASTGQDMTEHNTYVVSDSSNPTHKIFLVSTPKEEDLERIYLVYPKRSGGTQKKQGMKKLKKILQDPNQFGVVNLAVKNYAEYCAKEKIVGTKFVKMFGSFFDSDENWKEWSEEKNNAEPKSRSVDLFKGKF